MSAKRTLVAGGTVATDYGVFPADVLIEDDHVVSLPDHEDLNGADEVIDATAWWSCRARSTPMPTSRILAIPSGRTSRRDDVGGRRRDHDRDRASAHVSASHDG
jgi:hypothetical protein